MDDVKIGEILQPDDDSSFANEQRVRDSFWPKFKRVASNLPFASDILSAYYCAMDPETPTRVRGVLFAALAYFILPLDSLPDFIVGFGFTDDIAVLTAAFAAVHGSIKKAHRAAAKNTLDEWKTAELETDQS
ncbi:MAG: YkvA family protein [Pseudomonadota bacterium]